MTEEPKRPGRRAAMRAVPGFLGLALAACAFGGPPPATYVLGRAAADAAPAMPLSGRPIVEVKPVLVPDYLDVTDIVVRREGNVVTPSTTGRWAERLSAGVSRAIVAEIGRRVPRLVVSSTVSAGRPSRQVLVELQDFGPRNDGSIVLLAQWRVLDPGGARELAGETLSLTASLRGQGDAEIVAAMGGLVEQLAERIADAIGRITPGGEPRASSMRPPREGLRRTLLDEEAPPPRSRLAALRQNGR